MKTHFLVAVDADRWTAARIVGEAVELGDAVDGEDRAAAVRGVLDEWDYDGQGVCLALSAAMVFAAQIDCDGLPRKGRHEAMRYRLEEQLPLDIEALAADFLPPAGGRALGAAVEVAAVRRIVDALAGEGVPTAMICPTALLALWGIRPEGGDEDYILVAGDETIDVFRMREARPIAWQTVGDDSQLALSIRADLLAHRPEGDRVTARVVGRGASPDGQVRGPEELTVVERIDEPALTVAARMAGRILSGAEPGRLDLRRDALVSTSPWGRHGRLPRTAIVLALVAVSAAAGASWWRGWSYGRAAEADRAAQVAIYSDLHPGRRVPAAVHGRLRSELRRLAGTGGESTALPRGPGALDVLLRVAAKLPPRVRLNVLEMRITENDIFIDGRTRTHSDAQALQRALSAGGFEMRPPRTERLGDKGVSFTLVGRPGEGFTDSENREGP